MAHISNGCVCKVCGKPTDDCEFSTCPRCFIEGQDEDYMKDMVVGGRFYEKPKEEE